MVRIRYLNSICKKCSVPYLSDLQQDRKAQFTTKMYALFSILNISGNMTDNTHLQLTTLW